MKGGNVLARDTTVAAALLPTLTLPGRTEGAPAERRDLRATVTQQHSSSAIAITSDGATLLVVNPDSNSVTLVDTAALSGVPRAITITITARHAGYFPGGVNLVVPSSDVIITIRFHPTVNNPDHAWYTMEQVQTTLQSRPWWRYRFLLVLRGSMVP